MDKTENVYTPALKKKELNHFLKSRRTWDYGNTVVYKQAIAENQTHYGCYTADNSVGVGSSGKKGKRYNSFPMLSRCRQVRAK